MTEEGGGQLPLPSQITRSKSNIWTAPFYTGYLPVFERLQLFTRRIQWPALLLTCKRNNCHRGSSFVLQQAQLQKPYSVGTLPFPFDRRHVCGCAFLPLAVIPINCNLNQTAWSGSYFQPPLSGQFCENQRIERNMSSLPGLYLLPTQISQRAERAAQQRVKSSKLA